MDARHVLEELGDLRFYYQALLNMFGVDDVDIRALNEAKLVARYPLVEYSDDHAKARMDKTGDSHD